LKSGDPRELRQKLIDERYPVYADAGVVVDIDDSPPNMTTERVRRAIEDYLMVQQPGPDAAVQRGAEDPAHREAGAT
jgi:hypothetical protein